jgi:hypothetical protein
MNSKKAYAIRIMEAICLPPTTLDAQREENKKVAALGMYAISTYVFVTLFISGCSAAVKEIFC